MLRPIQQRSSSITRSFHTSASNGALKQLVLPPAAGHRAKGKSKADDGDQQEEGSTRREGAPSSRHSAYAFIRTWATLTIARSKT